MIWKKVFVLSFVGGMAFWLANFAISRTSIAAEYRAALSISYVPMLLEALAGGLIIGGCVSYFLLRFFDRIPAKDPVRKSLFLCLTFLAVVTLSIGNPSSYSRTNDALRYFAIGTIINLVRILALGIAIGYMSKFLNLRSRLQAKA